MHSLKAKIYSQLFIIYSNNSLLNFLRLLIRYFFVVPQPASLLLQGFLKWKSPIFQDGFDIFLDFF